MTRQNDRRLRNEPMKLVPLKDIDKAELVSDLSHELRTLLGGIIGINELLLASDLSKHQRKLSETIDHSSKLLLQVLNDLVDLSRADAGRLRIESAPVDVNKICQEAIEQNRTLSQLRPQVEFKYKAEGLPQLVLSDSTRLRQILTMLISNGLSLVQSGEVQLTASARECNDSEVDLTFRVEGPRPSDSEITRLNTICSATRERCKYDSRWISFNLCAQLAALLSGRTGFAVEGESFELWVEFRLPRPPLG